MSWIDYVVFGAYMAAVLAVGLYYFRRNRSAEDYYVGSRSIKAHHVGLSVVATDVGGGFSIGLGGLGFAMGLSGSWLLFTGLIGAWLSAVLIIPRLKAVDAREGMFTYPDFLRFRYNGQVALVAALISGIGYMGFTGAQVLAGAKLASATFLTAAPWGMTPLQFSLIIIAFITIAYTVLGGLKAVIYTDTIQWIVLLAGLTLVTIPMALHEIGGIAALRRELPAEFFSLTNVRPVQLLNWAVTIIPIWLIAMTLYQRMFACRDVKEARRAWFIAGVFEWPVMAFTGVVLGMCARVVFPEAESEMGLPLLIREILPAGVTGIVIASYFSAIMSTADSCMMASSGNFVNDVLHRYFLPKISEKGLMRVSQAATLAIGLAAVVIAAQFAKVLDAILFAYTFMVAGLFVPTLGAYFWRRATSTAALAAMVAGGVTALALELGAVTLPEPLAQLEIAASFYGILASAAVFIPTSLLTKRTPDRAAAAGPTALTGMNSMNYDRIEKLQACTVQHGPNSRRVYLMKMHPGAQAETALQEVEELAGRYRYGKIFAKAPGRLREAFLRQGYLLEARVPGFYRDGDEACFLARFRDRQRACGDEPELLQAVLEAAQAKAGDEQGEPDSAFEFRRCTADEAPAMAQVYRQVFESYPFPIHDPQYLRETMGHIFYYGAYRAGELVALSSAETDPANRNVEMTDFATLPAFRGDKLAGHLLTLMDRELAQAGYRTAYTIARAYSYGMNITFARAGYSFAGTLTKNTDICGRIECMNVWYKPLAGAEQMAAPAHGKGSAATEGC